VPTAPQTSGPQAAASARATSRVRQGPRRASRVASLLTCVLAGALSVLALAGQAAAARVVSPRPVVHVVLGRTRLPASASTLKVMFFVQRATRCRLAAPTPITITRSWQACADGHVQTVVQVRANSSSVPWRGHVTVWAYGPGGRAGAVAFFVQSPAPAHKTPPSGTAAGPSPGASVPGSSAPSTAGGPVPEPGVLAPLVVTTVALPSATVGMAYSATLSATGGTSPYRWSIIAGSLPSGLTLAPSGALSGVPTAAGTSSFVVSVLDARIPPAHAQTTLVLAVANAPYVGQDSSNWAGYVISSGGPLVTEASGQWKVPELDCARTPAGGLATWVGIGGAIGAGGTSTGELLQTGVTTSCNAGSQSNIAWWEEYPSTPNSEIDFSGLALAPGDVVRASVYKAAGDTWVTRLDDLTTGESGVMVTGEGWGVSFDGSGTFSDQGSTANLFYSGGTSAEWIAEDYEQAGSLVPLAAYGTLTFSQLTTSLSPWSLTASDAVEMVQNGSVLSVPSAPGSDSFTVAYTGP
jgi:hypothetical protein